MQEIYRPLLRWYFACFGLYYGLMLPTHLLDYAGAELYAMLALAGGAFVVAVTGWVSFGHRLSIPRAEGLVLLLNVLVVANVVTALNINFDSIKLVYFVIIAIAFSLASVSMRQAAVSILLAGIGYASFLPKLDTATFLKFGFVSIAATIAAMSIAILMRRAMTTIAEAKLEAENELDIARQLERTLRTQSLSDELTGLPNRRAFFLELDAATNHVARGRAAWLILLDLDGFKAVNDIHGHSTGDRLLSEVAERIRSVCGDDMHASRMGGDEFNMILSGEGGVDAVRRRCEALLASLANSYQIEGRHIRISASIGFKLLDNESSAAHQLTQADYALIIAKKRGKNRAVEFTAELEQASDERAEIESALRQADLDAEVNLVFQPQFDFAAERIVAAEALARWDSPIVGRISPDHFIRIAEESGLITGITMTVVEKAFRAAVSWDPPLCLSINLSSFDLISDPNIDQIIDLSRRYGVDPAMIEFEVTETAMMADFEKATANLKRLSDLGFAIALDDFGTGYSNFSYLRALPINKLKVDRSFLDNPGDPMTERMLSSLAGMARLLGVHCLLEGIEDEIGLLMAKRVGAQSAQGYLFGAPMSQAELIGVVESAANDVRLESEEGEDGRELA